MNLNPGGYLLGYSPVSLLNIKSLCPFGTYIRVESRTNNPKTAVIPRLIFANFPIFKNNLTIINK
jgi:hypothetical protein